MEVYMLVFAVCLYKILVMLHAMKRRGVQKPPQNLQVEERIRYKSVLHTFNE